MPADRFFLPEFFSPGLKTVLQDDESLHLTRVMRKKEGDSIELINGKGELAQAKIEKVEKKQVHLTLESFETKAPLLPPLILVQALPKPSHLELILQKGTELGATEFWFFPGDLSEKKAISDQQTRRHHQILVAALKQCGRLDLPKIALKPKLLNLSFPKESTFFGDLRKSAPLFKETKLSPSPPYYFIVGPEKGFSEQEVAHLDSQATGVKLHPYILRAETAALSALTLFSHFLS